MMWIPNGSDWSHDLAKVDEPFDRVDKNGTEILGERMCLF